MTETEHLLEEFTDPAQVVTPDVFVHRLVAAREREKAIEKRTVRPKKVANA